MCEPFGEVTCYDGQDNDNDGFVDCADIIDFLPDCEGRFCDMSMTTTCFNGFCNTL